MTTPHISAAPGDIARRVIMPGDPRRAERMAHEYLEGAKLVTDVRGILGFTGEYDGREITVMASGMGMPSLTIYATELAREYGVQQIIRVGTAGALTASVALGDVVIATAAHTDSRMSDARIPGVSFSHTPDFTLAAAAIAAAGDAAVAGTVRTGALFTSDHFYLDRPAMMAALAQHGTLAVDMEAAGLYAIGAAESVRTLAIVTITDNLETGEKLTSRDREENFATAARIALGL